MSVPENGGLLRWADLPAALGLLTRLPLPAAPSGPPRGAASAWAWPVAGLALALAAAVLACALNAGAGLSPGLTAGLVLAALAMMTGALHEDGLADSADGLWGGRDPAARLAIMKDSRIGSYGVLALGLVTGLRWLALAELIGAGAALPALLAACTLSRAPMAVLSAWLPNARGTGLSASVGRVPPATAALAAALATALALAATGWAGLAALAAVALVSLLLAQTARARIGGQTGDILGASQQLAEAAALIALATALA